MHRLAVPLVALSLLAGCGNEPTPAAVERAIESNDTVIVPAVSGKELEAARSLLEARGLEVEVERQRFPELRPGMVVDEQPPAGTVVESGTTVKLEVSSRR